jgi:hypothetical protein
VKAWQLLLVLPLLAVVAWIAARGRHLRDDPADVLRALKRASGPTLPAAGAAGATTLTPLETYDRETLYEYIDGAAEAFLARGFQRCTVGNYTFSSNGSTVEVAAEVYRFAPSAGAAAQLAADRPTGGRDVVGLPGAVSDETVLMMVAGADLLRLTVVTTGPPAGAALVQIAGAWRRENGG